jgi:hypothetical protein
MIKQRFRAQPPFAFLPVGGELRSIRDIMVQNKMHGEDAIVDGYVDYMGIKCIVKKDLS